MSTPSLVLTAEDIAKICHEANRAFCESQQDFSQKPWAEAEEWQRDSMIQGVRWRLANMGAPESAQHDAWMRSKIAAGWRHGEVKDAIAKTHPCLMPYEQLPAAQQRKDHLITAIVRTLA